VTEVRVSGRLKDSPALLVLGEHDLGDRLRRILSAAGQKVPEAKPLLEVNVTHPLVRYLETIAEPGEFSELSLLLYEQAQLAEGAALPNPPDFVLRLNRLLVRLATPKGRSPPA
jgi:molecular chaperone HtpG